jgi:hypothetical protein
VDSDRSPVVTCTIMHTTSTNLTHVNIHQLGWPAGVTRGVPFFKLKVAFQDHGAWRPVSNQPFDYSFGFMPHLKSAPTSIRPRSVRTGRLLAYLCMLQWIDHLRLEKCRNTNQVQSDCHLEQQGCTGLWTKLVSPPKIHSLDTKVLWPQLQEWLPWSDKRCAKLIHNSFPRHPGGMATTTIG